MRRLTVINNTRQKDGKTSTDDLKEMMMSFSMDELQTLLSFCGIKNFPRYRHKNELLGRAKSLLTGEGPARQEIMKSKILELHNQRLNFVNVAVPPTNDNGNPSALTNPATNYLHAQSYLNQQSTYINQANYSKHYTTQPPPRTSMAAISSATICDPRLYQPVSMHPANAMPIHPDVRFISLPFYDVVDILMKPTSLQRKTMTGYQDTNLVYHLTPYQTQLITNSRSYIKTMIEYAVQVHLRFCLNETSCVQEDIYPTRCKIVVNGKGIPLPGQPPPNAQNQEPRKPHRPVNITSFCRLSPMQSNHIQVQWVPSDLGQRYTATVHLVQSVQADTLIQRLANKPIRSKEHSIGFIKEKLSPDPDSEVAMTSLKVSLCCPIGRTRMSMPCRTNNCKHLQCFDGSTYIQMNEHKPSWVCPVCDQKAYYGDLFKDGLFTSIIAEATNCEDIVFFADGSWRSLDDIQQEQDGSKPLADVVNTPKPLNKPVSNIGCETSPVLPSPETFTIANPSPASASNIPSTPTLDLRPRVQEDSNTNNDEQSQTPEKEDDIEIIMIDSDSDSEDTVPNKTNESSGIATSGQRFNSAETGTTTGLSLFSDPGLQGLELYNLLTHEDRIAASMCLDQNGMFSQLSNVTDSQQSPLANSIIDISDESG